MDGMGNDFHNTNPLENNAQPMDGDTSGSYNINSDSSMNTPKGSFCIHCGAQLAEGAAVCVQCGNTVKNFDQEKKFSQQNQPTGYRPQQTHDGQQPQMEYQQPMYGFNQPPLSPQGQALSRKEYLENYFPAFKKEVKVISIITYVLVGINILVSIFTYPLGIIDGLAFLGLTLGMHIGKSRACANIIFGLGIFEVIFAFATLNSFAGWGWLAVGISAFTIFNKAQKQYKEYLNQVNSFRNIY